MTINLTEKQRSQHVQEVIEKLKKDREWSENNTSIKKEDIIKKKNSSIKIKVDFIGLNRYVDGSTEITYIGTNIRTLKRDMIRQSQLDQKHLIK